MMFVQQATTKRSIYSSMVQNPSMGSCLTKHWKMKTTRIPSVLLSKWPTQPALPRTPPRLPASAISSCSKKSSWSTLRQSICLKFTSLPAKTITNLHPKLSLSLTTNGWLSSYLLQGTVASTSLLLTRMEMFFTARLTPTKTCKQFSQQEKSVFSTASMGMLTISYCVPTNQS